mmetsp:Transcript_11192/g.23482  ORF Transcript_11192/g.23482 Transcript_11192/m.23482 type:complete len:228 (-) Transcript_11192:408-1091(-)
MFPFEAESFVVLEVWAAMALLCSHFNVPLFHFLWKTVQLLHPHILSHLPSSSVPSVFQPSLSCTNRLIPFLHPYPLPRQRKSAKPPGTHHVLQNSSPSPPLQNFRFHFQLLQFLVTWKILQPPFKDRGALAPGVWRRTEEGVPHFRSWSFAVFPSLALSPSFAFSSAVILVEHQLVRERDVSVVVSRILYQAKPQPVQRPPSVPPRPKTPAAPAFARNGIQIRVRRR